MWTDPIIEEIHKNRQTHAAKFNYDIHAIVKDFQDKQKRRARPVVSFIDKNRSCQDKKIH